ncbi:hypothetical protein R3W88_000755 [Solanum pinnatisectum]|uniref:Gag-pol polyprotein n=1 Tax=Solanum pinnatisectum TaxID=50273 RepID=A0AAV9MGT5_9SOLN|nr:hypothetical protein R3W88_000755 [Solanum pinnatisectum]
MVADMRSRMSLFVAGLARLSSKEGRAAMLIGDIDISRLIVYVQQKQKGPAPSSASAPAPKNKGEYNNQNFIAKLAYSRGSVAQGGSKPSACVKCGRNHSGICREGSTGCFKTSREMVIEAIEPSLLCYSTRVAPRGTTSNTGRGTNRLYAINNRQEQENSPDVVTGMIQVFDFTIYALLDPGTSLSFVTPYVAMNFDVIPE